MSTLYLKVRQDGLYEEGVKGRSEALWTFGPSSGSRIPSLCRDPGKVAQRRIRQYRLLPCMC